MSLKIISAAVVALAWATAAQAAQLAINGDFEAGDVGFVSGYQPGDVNPPTSYAIAAGPSSAPGAWGDWQAFGDHTSGFGQMMVVNGADTSGAPIWSQTFAVLPGSTYDVSFWGATSNLLSPDPGRIQAFVNGAPIGSVLSLPNAGGGWVNGGGVWNSGSANFASLTLVDLNLEVQWNDFALDDISFDGPAGPPPPPLGANLTFNGDFEAGATGFGSSYAFGDVNPPSTYVVGASAAAAPGAWGDWQGFGDHTSGQGQMLIANGGAGDIWTQTVVVAPDTTYDFSFWAASSNLSTPDPALLQAFVNGTPVGKVLLLPNGGGQWASGGGLWFSDLSATAILTLVDQNGAEQWNDFVLDDIRFVGLFDGPPPSAVPEPRLWSMMMLGLWAIGAGLRRRAGVAVRAALGRAV